MEPPDKSNGVLEGREILLCLTGGIACYKSADLASTLVQKGAGLTVAMTEAATKFIAPLTFRALTGRRVYRDLWNESSDFSIQHVSLTEKADLMIIAPATADILAKMACGIADDLVSTMALSAHGSCPVLVAPAMNSRMWNAPATMENCETLKKRGVMFTGPSEGKLACGESGEGRMVEVAEIVEAVCDLV